MQKTKSLLIYFFLAVISLYSGQKACAGNSRMAALRQFLDKYDTITLDQQKTFLDTVIFEHRNEHFFTVNASLNRLANGNYVIVQGGEYAYGYLYDRDGKFIRGFAGTGQGPGEILGNAFDLDSDSRQFYVSDGIQAKIIIYNHQGDFISEVKYSRKYAPVSFTTAPINNTYLYCHLFPRPNAPFLTLGSLESGIMKEFGDIDEINSVSQHAGGLVLAASCRNGYYYVIKPQEYGFEIYTDTGEYVKKIHRPEPDYFKPVTPRIFRKKDEPIKGNMHFPTRHFNNTRSEKIFYMGNNVLVIIYVKYHVRGTGQDVTFQGLVDGTETWHAVQNLEFWSTGGEFLGHSEVEQIAHLIYAENGCLFYWHQSNEPDAYGLEPNPKLIKYNIFEEAEMFGK